MHRFALPLDAARPTTTRGRLAGFDAVRGIAMLAGVLLHAAIAYAPNPIGGCVWPVHEPTSDVCGVVYWSVHAVRLPVLFFLSGFFTEHLLQTRSASEFLHHRIRRLVVPYSVAAITILPVSLVIWVMGWLTTGQCELDPNCAWGIRLGSKLPSTLFNPGHLWFLLDLIIMTGTVFVIRREIPSDLNAKPTCAFWLIGPIKTPCLLATIPTMILWGQTSPITQYHNSFLLDAPRLLYFFPFFTLGMCAYLRRDEFFENATRPVLNLAFAAICVTGTLFFVTPEIGGTGGLVNRFAFSVCVGLSAWFTIFGAMGLVLHCDNLDRPAIRYLADAAYWVYLVHLPIVGLGHIALYPVALPPVLKMLIVFVATSSVSLGSYTAFVRYSIIGEFLHGRRTRPHNWIDQANNLVELASSTEAPNACAPARRAA